MRGVEGLSSRVDTLRVAHSVASNREDRAAIGQFLTPSDTARLLAQTFDLSGSTVSILDPGAGIGSLTVALIERLLGQRHRPAHIRVTCVENDSRLLPTLKGTLSQCFVACRDAGVEFSAELISEDFLGYALKLIGRGERPYTAVIMNPPYKKISAQSLERALLEQVGVEVVNLYAAFVSLAHRLLSEGGQLCFITPRSFCNGPYYLSFRKDLVSNLTLRSLHVFESRQSAFSEDSVLQENVIASWTRTSARKSSGAVLVSSSEDATGSKRSLSAPIASVINPNDADYFIHIVTTRAGSSLAKAFARLPSDLEQLGLKVSTGPVVDFRLREHLVPAPTAGAVPLVWPCHLRNGRIQHPAASARKPNGIIVNSTTEKWLTRNGCYVLVKRFSSKEERRRVVATVLNKGDLSGDVIGLENHLNYYHCTGAPLDAAIARGLAAFLNTEFVDQYFRQFNGHTQVNATDLRKLRYPTPRQLLRIAAAKNCDQAAENFCAAL